MNTNTTTVETTKVVDEAAVRAIREEYDQVDRETEELAARVRELALKRSNLVEKLYNATGGQKKVLKDGKVASIVSRKFKNANGEEYTRWFIRGVKEVENLMNF